MKQIIFWLVTFLLLISVQNSLAHFITIGGIKPNFVMVYIVFVGLFFGRKYGMIMGFFCGIVLDILNGYFFGFNTFTLMIIGIVSGKMQKEVFEDSISFPLMLVASLGFFQEILWSFCVILSGYLVTDFLYIFANSFLATLYNILLALPLLFIARRMRKLLV